MTRSTVCARVAPTRGLKAIRWRGASSPRSSWDTVDWAAVDRGELPTDGELPDEGWQVGDVEGGVRRSRPDLRRDRVPPVAGSSAARNAYGDGVLAERQVLPALLDAEHGPDARRRRPHDRDRTREPRADRRVLWRGLRQQDQRLGSNADPGSALAEGRQAGDDADRPARGELHRSRKAGDGGGASRSASVGTAG